jgi:hypothetical protein
MSKRNRQKFTMDRPVIYQIKVPGKLDSSWSELVEGKMVMVESEDDNLPITTLTGTFDQAALLGFLRRLYSLGLPLISAICVQFD